VPPRNEKPATLILPSNPDNGASAPPPSSRRSAVPWLLAAFFVPLYIYLNLVSLQETLPDSYEFPDFHASYAALDHAARGEPVYDLESLMPFLYPPFFLIVLWPLSWLGEPMAVMVWLHLQTVFLVISLVALLAVFWPPRRTLTAWTIVLFTSFSPVLLNNLFGQTNLFYLAFLSLFVLGYTRGGERSPRARLWDIGGALALSAAISTRLLPLALLILAAIRRRYRFSLWTAAFVGIEALAAGARVGFATEWHYFSSYVFHLHDLRNMREISLLALGHLLAPPWLGTLLFALAVAAGLAVFFASVYGPIRRRPLSPALPIAFVVASMALFAPLLEYHHYTILLVPYALILGELMRRESWHLTSALPVFLSSAIVSASNYFSHFGYRAMAFAALAGAALIWAYAVWLIQRTSGDGD
jgi:hypothetical protein